MSTGVPLASITLSSSTSSITFNQIPETYTDLIIVCSLQSTASQTSDSRHLIKVGNNTISNSGYSITTLYGTGSLTRSSRETNRAQWDNVTTVSSNSTGEFTNIIYQIQNYSNSTTYKTVLYKAGQTTNVSEPNGAGVAVGLWQNLNPINIVEIYIGVNGQMSAGSTINLYGINAANSAQAKATGGDSIYRDASYWYHIFNKSGTFTPAQSLSNVEYLVVAGGGGGGSSYNGSCGGGGAGGYRSSVVGESSGGGASAESRISLNSGINYTVTVGAGGAGGATPNNHDNGLNGSSSSISGSGITTITSTGGGGGAGREKTGESGGSGGGGGATTVVAGSGGALTANQGYAGGSGSTASPYRAGGGGGAGETGNTDANGEGGDGISSSITGSSVTRAGGGGGGIYLFGAGGGSAGGSGGGGAGSRSVSANQNTTATAGAGNTGSGGGGGGADQIATGTGAAGGSGIVIVRYSV